MKHMHFIDIQWSAAQFWPRIRFKEGASIFIKDLFDYSRKGTYVYTCVGNASFSSFFRPQASEKWSFSRWVTNWRKIRFRSRPPKRKPWGEFWMEINLLILQFHHQVDTQRACCFCMYRRLLYFGLADLIREPKHLVWQSRRGSNLPLFALIENIN